MTICLSEGFQPPHHHQLDKGMLEQLVNCFLEHWKETFIQFVEKKHTCLITNVLQQKINILAMGVLKRLVNCFLDVLKEVTIFMFFLYEITHDNFQLFN